MNLSPQPQSVVTWIKDSRLPILPSTPGKENQVIILGNLLHWYPLALVKKLSDYINDSKDYFLPYQIQEYCTKYGNM